MGYSTGRNGGWWEFDVRTAEQIESKFNETSDGPKTLELMIAGFIYIIDLDAMVSKTLKIAYKTSVNISKLSKTQCICYRVSVPYWF